MGLVGGGRRRDIGTTRISVSSPSILPSIEISTHSNNPSSKATGHHRIYTYISLYQNPINLPTTHDPTTCTMSKNGTCLTRNHVPYLTVQLAPRIACTSQENPLSHYLPLPKTRTESCRTMSCFHRLCPYRARSVRPKQTRRVWKFWNLGACASLRWVFGHVHTFLGRRRIGAQRV